MLRRAFDWFFRDRSTGRIVIGQWPNPPLWLFGVSALVGIATAGTRLGTWAELASRIFLAWWAADELLRGVNPWRRCLGGVVFVWLALQIFD